MKPSHLLRFCTGAMISLGLGLALAAQDAPPPPPPPDESPAPAVDGPPPAPGAESSGELRRLDLPDPAAAAAEAEEAAEAAANQAEAQAADVEAQAGESASSAEPEDEPAPVYSGEIVRIGADALLPSEQAASEVVAIFGNVIADGPVHGSSVAVMGDNTTNHSADVVVAVLGNVHVNGHVRGEVVAVMGTVHLGPNAVVDGEVVCVGGRLDLAPGAVVNGPVHQVGPFPVVADGLQGLRGWFRSCLLLGRPLAFETEVLWAWGVAFSFVGVYLLISLLFNRAVVVSAETLEQRPGMTIIVAVVAAVLGPVLVLLLSVVGVGLLLIPVMFLIGLFGKAAFLAWLGRRATLPLGWSHSFGAVLIGGLILLLLYTIPFAGFLVMKVTSGLGFGMAVYAAILAMRREPAKLPPASPGSAVPGVAAMPAPSPQTSAASPAGATAPVAPAAAPMDPAASGLVADEPAAGPSTPPPVPVVPPAPSYAPPPAPPPPPIQFSTLPRAGFWIRLAASLLDLILLVLMLNLIDLENLWPVVYGIYCAVLWALRGTTVGGIICGLKVVRLDDRKLDWPVAIVRSLGGYLSLAVVGLGFVWVAFDPERQSWHDKIAGTTVVRVPKGVSLV